MSNLKQRKWLTSTAKRDDIRVSSGLVGAVRTTLGQVDGVHDVLLLHRSDTKQVSKFFVILQTPSLEVVERVVSAMVQLEDAFAGERFDYDTVPRTKDPLVPSGASSLLHGAR